LKYINYLRYFIFLTQKWNLTFALSIIKDELRGEKFYGIETSGINKLEHLRKKGIDTSHATLYMPAPYSLLEEIFSFLKPLGLNHLLDVGCGKGRILCVGTHFGFKNITGLDLSKAFCRAAEKNLYRCSENQNLTWKLINNDAYYYDIPPQTDCIFIFNPFDEFLLEKVVENINASLIAHPRPLYIVYITALHREIFFQHQFDVYASFHPGENLEALILKKNGHANA